MTSVQKTLDFIRSSPSPFQTVENISKILDSVGFIRLSESKKWELEAGQKYYVSRNQSSLIAFSVPENQWNGFRITASHSDSPTFKLKEEPENYSDKYIRINCEKYGGAILSSWLDRQLSIAGRIIHNKNDILSSQLFSMQNIHFIIPSMAIHLQNPQTFQLQHDFFPMVGIKSNDSVSLRSFISSYCDIPEKNILSHDLFLYCAQDPCYSGLNNEFYSSPRIDNLSCAYTTLRGFMKGVASEKINVYSVFDHEEVGSTTQQGAASTFLQNTLERISYVFSKTSEEHMAQISNSFLISADNGHAVHPNHPEIADSVNRTYLNQGIMIKRNASQKYTTDAVSSAHVQKICMENNIPYQHYANRSDIPGGSTLGNISNTKVSLHTADIGLPQLSMHSAFETAGVLDVEYMIRFIHKFYETSFQNPVS